jgi:hypothetical protein
MQFRCGEQRLSHYNTMSLPMKRRRFLALASLLVASTAHSAESGTSMSTARIGPWEFSIPEDWVAKESTYLESRDGAVGCYVKRIGASMRKTTARDFAEEIQAIHEASFRKATQRDWRLMARTGAPSGPFFKSRLDMLDEANKYRVLSLVLASADDALQVTIHNYLCEDYSANRDAYLPVEQSLRHT